MPNVTSYKVVRPVSQIFNSDPRPILLNLYNILSQNESKDKIKKKRKRKKRKQETREQNKKCKSTITHLLSLLIASIKKQKKRKHTPQKTCTLSFNEEENMGSIDSIDEV